MSPPSLSIAASCVTRYFQIPAIPQLELKRCEFVDGKCSAEVERQICDGPEPTREPEPAPARTLPAGSSPAPAGGGAGGASASTDIGKSADQASGATSFEDGAPIFAGILIILTCGTMGVALGTGCFGLAPRLMAKRRAAARPKPSRRAARPYEMEMDEGDDPPPPSVAGAPAKAIGFSFMSRQAKHIRGAMRLPDADDEEEGLEFGLTARPKPTAGRGKLSADNYAL